MSVQRTFVALALAAALGGCSKSAAFYGHSTTSTTMVGGTQRPATTLGPPIPTTATTGPTAKTGGPKLDAEQIIGRWRVVGADYGAAFSDGDRLAFLEDGTFSLNGGLVGDWHLMVGSVMMINLRTVHAAYTVSFSKGEMDLNMPGGSISLARTN